MRSASAIQIVLILLVVATFSTARTQQTDGPGSVGMECHGFLLDRAATPSTGSATTRWAFHFLPANYKRSR